VRATWVTSALCAALILYVQALSAAEFRRLAFHVQVDTSPSERFVAAEAFKVGNRIGDRIVSVVAPNFAVHFLGVVETGVGAVSLQAWTLRYSVDDALLIKIMGGEGKAVLPLSSIHRVIELGAKGGSHTDWRSNFAYARSPADGRLRAIHWFVNHADEWVIGATDVPHPNLDWPTGSRVFGRTLVEAKRF
jgi:hypothetical protein